MKQTDTRQLEPPTGRPVESTGADQTVPVAGAVTARGLVRDFGDKRVIHGLDLTLEPGTILGLIGPSGCGKTTTVRLLTGLLAPTEGEALVGDTPATELTSAQRARIGYLPQSSALFPELSLVENLSFHASMYGLPFRRRHRLNYLLDWVELGDDRRTRVSDASGGMQRRLALAAAFVQDPDLVFLDEPTAGIDPILRDKFWDQFRHVAKRGRSLIVTTQYVGEAGMCDVVGLLSDGELLLLDTPENLRRAAFSGEVVDVRLARPLDDQELARVAAHDFVIGDVERVGPLGIRVAVDDADAAIGDLRTVIDGLGVEVVEIDEHIVTYDEAFVRVVERHRNATSESPDADEDAQADGDGDENRDGDRDGDADAAGATGGPSGPPSEADSWPGPGPNTTGRQEEHRARLA